MPNEPWYEQYHQVKNSHNWRSWPLIRHLRALHLRRLAPLGKGRHGDLSVIRYYWADFLEQQRADVTGHALEIGETATIRYYGAGRLTQADALDLSAHSPEVRIVADLARADHVPGEQYDCFVLQFTNNVIFDITSALYHAIRLLQAGQRVVDQLLVHRFLLPAMDLDMGTGAPLYMHWFFTPIQVENLLHSLGLTTGDYTLKIYGNLLAKTAFLMNLPVRELTAHERDTYDPGQPLLICARIVRPNDWRCTKPTAQDPHWLPAAAPLVAHPETGHYGDAYLR